MKILWTREALNNLRAIKKFISINSYSAAENFIEKIIARADAISDSPKQGRVVPEFANDSIREIIFKKYRIVYLIKENHVEILTVFEGHKLLKRNMKRNG